MTTPGLDQRRISRMLRFALVFLMVLVASYSVHAQTFTVLYSFLGSPDGQAPNGLIRDAKGHLYGTTFRGGASYHGSAFKLSGDGTEIVLYSFLGGYGSWPDSELTLDTKGNLYGGTYGGGAHGSGVVFKLDKKGNETVLHSFKGQSSDGAYPSNVILDEAGNLYGTTQVGGGSTGYGTVFKLDKAGRETVLYTFAEGADGEFPSAGVIRDNAGNLYGTTLLGGDLSCGGGYGCGAVFKLDTAGKETVLYGFAGGTDGSQPYGGLTQDGAGNFYGTTSQGGDPSCGSGGSGCGTVFKLDKSGKETVLYRFTGTGEDGAYPYAGVVRDRKGNLYGATYAGGGVDCSYGEGKCGTLFKLDPAGKETVLHSFSGGPDGALPTGLIRDAAGNLYGTAAAGGTSDCNGGYFGSCGTVFKLTP